MTKLLLILLYLTQHTFSEDFEQAVLTISGAYDLEDLNAQDLERFYSLSLNPIDINTASRSRLIASGLFSSFQVASILEYRLSSGDILSWTELSLVNGFNEDYCKALKPFVQIQSQMPPGQRRHNNIKQNLLLRSGLRQDGYWGEHNGEASKTQNDNLKLFYGLKYEFTFGDYINAYYSSRKSYDSPTWKPLGTISAAIYGKRHLGKIVIGDFAARFGQGMCLWTSETINSLMTLQSYRRNASGLCSTGSYNSKEKGVGVDFEFASWTISAAWSMSSSKPMANINYTGRDFSIGCTSTLNTNAIDFKWSLPALSIFGEGAWDGQPIASSGLIWTPTYGHNYGIVAKYKDHKLQWAAGLEYPQFEAHFESKLDFNKRVEQYRLQALYSKEFSSALYILKPSIRLDSRYKPALTKAWRTDLRLAFSASSDQWQFNFRYDAVCGLSFAHLGYAEMAYSTKKESTLTASSNSLSVWLRLGLFKVDYWDDRIYVYERDAPGSFNMRANYGRGCSASLVAALSFGNYGRHKIHCRISAINYWGDKKDRIELSLQYYCKLSQPQSLRDSP